MGLQRSVMAGVTGLLSLALPAAAEETPKHGGTLTYVIPADAPQVMIPDSEHHIMVDQPLALVAALRALLAAWPA